MGRSATENKIFTWLVLFLRLVGWLVVWLFWLVVLVGCLLGFVVGGIGQSGLSFSLFVSRLFVCFCFLSLLFLGLTDVPVSCLQFHFCSVVISNRGGLELIFDWSLISSRERRRRRHREDWGKVTLNKSTVVVLNPRTLSLPPSPISLLISTPRTFRTGSSTVSDGVLYDDLKYIQPSSETSFL